MMRKVLTMVSAALMLAAVSAPASAGSWTFGVVNEASDVVIGFRTEEGGAWSDNWLTEAIAPGDVFEMDFGTDEGVCEVRTQVLFADNSYFDYMVDYCEVSNLYLYDDEIRWD